MKSLTAFAQVLLEDLEEWCGVSAPRDHQTVASRVEHEGFSFLTITLPAFGKDLEKALADGQIGDDHFCGFARSGRIPKFLGCFLRLVFDRDTGVLLDNPDVRAIRCLRQFTLAFQKIEVECSQERIDAAFSSYVECEQDLKSLDLGSLREFTRVANTVLGTVFQEVEKEVNDLALIPKHGPGATAERVKANAKYTVTQWTHRLDRYFPVADFVIPNHRYWQDLQDAQILEPWEEIPVRVIAVPKTLKTPRIIAIEPTCMQYAQQALARRFVELLERDDILSSLIGFTDQIPNREMAREGSLTGDLATLDLSEASDRVSNSLVEALLLWYPDLSGAVQACRSTTADVPGYGVIPLTKFASMGSALCFPMEAMVFLTIIIQAIAEASNTQVTRQFVSGLKGRVRVYGDDIIVPVEFAPMVVRSLEAHGLKVNHRKSFWTGSFRESCGGDYYDGHWVTPVRVRSKFPSTIEHVEELQGTTALRNQLFELGLRRSVQWLDHRLGRILPVYPVVPANTAALGRLSWSPATADRHCTRLQRPLVKACVVKYTIPPSWLDGRGALLKFFLTRGWEPLSEDSFRRAGRPVSARITTQYVPI